MIQALYIRSTETRSIPKPHVVYRIEVHAANRTWSVWRRYSDFVALQEGFKKPPPTALPQKHWFASSVGNPVQIEERRRGLELYLRSLLEQSDSQWRDSIEFKEFLNIPKTENIKDIVTSQSWMDAYTATQVLARDVRAQLNRKETSQTAAASHAAGADARKLLSKLSTSLSALEQGLEILATEADSTGKVLSEGELRRRTDLLNGLRNEREVLTKMAAAVVPTSPSPSSAAFKSSSPEPSTGVRPSRRTFGKPANIPPPLAVETDETRPLENASLMQLQQRMMDDQDTTLEQFSAILRRQKELGTAIGNELDLHNEMLDDLNDDVDRVGGKLKGARRKLNKIS